MRSGNCPAGVTLCVPRGAGCHALKVFQGSLDSDPIEELLSSTGK